MPPRIEGNVAGRHKAMYDRQSSGPINMIMPSWSPADE